MYSVLEAKSQRISNDESSVFIVRFTIVDDELSIRLADKG